LSDGYEEFASNAPSTSERVGQASLKYNCFAYATGNTGYWVNALQPFITAGDWVLATVPTDPDGQNRAGHNAEGGPGDPWDHASKITSTSVTVCGNTETIYKAEGKYGMQAKYKTNLARPNLRYNTDSYYYSE